MIHEETYKKHKQTWVNRWFNLQEVIKRLENENKALTSNKFIKILENEINDLRYNVKKLKKHINDLKGEKSNLIRINYKENVINLMKKNEELINKNIELKIKIIDLEKIMLKKNDM